MLRGKWWKETNTAPGERTAPGSDSEGAKRATWGRNEAESGKSEIKCEHEIVVRVDLCWVFKRCKTDGGKIICHKKFANEAQLYAMFGFDPVRSVPPIVW